MTGSSILVRMDPRPGSANSGSYATIADLEPLYARPCGSRASYYAASLVTQLSHVSIINNKFSLSLYIKNFFLFILFLPYINAFFFFVIMKFGYYARAQVDSAKLVNCIDER